MSSMEALAWPRMDAPGPIQTSSVTMRLRVSLAGTEICTPGATTKLETKTTPDITWLFITANAEASPVCTLMVVVAVLPTRRSRGP